MKASLRDDGPPVLHMMSHGASTARLHGLPSGLARKATHACASLGSEMRMVVRDQNPRSSSSWPRRVHDQVPLDHATQRACGASGGCATELSARMLTCILQPKGGVR